MRPSVRVENESMGVFLLRFYNMVKCVWNLEGTLKDNVVSFRDMSAWLLSHNQTLTANFGDANDAFAWNVSECSLF